MSRSERAGEGVVELADGWARLVVRRPAERTARSHLFRIAAIDVVEPIFRSPGDKGTRAIIWVGELRYESALTVDEIEGLLRG